jgi:hypothetical protein
MSNHLYHLGNELFRKFDLSVESEITFADHCKDMIFTYKYGIGFTSGAILFLEPSLGQDDWIESETIRFYSWENILSIQNISGIDVLAEFDQNQIRAWCSSLSVPEISYPYSNIREGNLAFIFQGQPRSVRSTGGKRKFREYVELSRQRILEQCPSPVIGYVEMHIDIFSTCTAELPDVDRLSTTIMDAFQGLVYKDDKQIKDLQPRVFDSSKAFMKLECQTEPVPHFELHNIPAGSLFPLATGILDYYVVRLRLYI